MKMEEYLLGHLRRMFNKVRMSSNDTIGVYDVVYLPKGMRSHSGFKGTQSGGATFYFLNNC